MVDEKTDAVDDSGSGAVGHCVYISLQLCSCEPWSDKTALDFAHRDFYIVVIM